MPSNLSKGLLAAVATGVAYAAVAATASAPVGVPTANSNATVAPVPVMEKCYGISAKSKNDCAGAMHSCAGQGAERGADDWIYVPEGTCQKISGGIKRVSV